MLSLVTIGIAAATVGLGQGPEIVPQRLYNGLARPVVITINSPPTIGPVALALMNAQGALAAKPREVRPGRVDLAEVLPQIWAIPQTCYLQLINGDQSVGSALVLQPMFSRLPPRTEQATRPNGSPYTRIVGWGPAEPQAASDESASDEQFDESAVARDTAEPAASPVGQRVLSGLRIYPDRDVVLHTTKGDIHLAMRPDEAPNTVWNFLELCEGGFYDEVIFHRVVPLTRDGRPFVIQAGDPTGSGEGGPGYWLPIEPSGLPHQFGVISMARADHPDSAGSQFFICLSREGTARLDGQYCAFGYAVNGAETIRAIAEVELADVAQGRPVDPPLIEWTELIPAPPRVPGQGRPDRPVSEQQAPVETQPARVPR